MHPLRIVDLGLPRFKRDKAKAERHRGHAVRESKTNFLAAIPVGDIAYAECTPPHRGKSTMVWQTKVMRGDGLVAAYVTQTQLVLPAR